MIHVMLVVLSKPLNAVVVLEVLNAVVSAGHYFPGF